MPQLYREGDTVALSRYGKRSQPGVKNPPIAIQVQGPSDGFVPPNDRYIMSLKPEDIELGYMDLRICDLIPKGPNSPVDHHCWGRRKSAMNPLNDFENSCKMAGRLKFMLFAKDVPKTVRNFKELIKEKDGTGYVHTNFHTIIPGFMVQGGDTEHQNGRGGISIYGRNMKDENFTVKHTHKGMMGMANMGPDTNGSQFYITQRPTPWLDDEHVVFGKLVDGFNVLKMMDEKCGDPQGQPAKFVQIVKCGMFKKKNIDKKDAEKSASVQEMMKKETGAIAQATAATLPSDSTQANQERILAAEVPKQTAPVLQLAQQTASSWWKFW